MSPARRRSLVFLGAALLVAALVGGRWLALETAERAWAQSIAGGEVYLAARGLARLMQVAVFVLALAWGTLNFFHVYRAIGSVQMPRRLGNLEIVEAVPRRLLLGATLASGLVYGIVLSWGTDHWWLAATLASAPPRFGVTDPILERDLGYYVAGLPWAATLQGTVLLAAVTGAVLVGLLYLGIGSLQVRGGRASVSPRARAHLGILLACVAAALGWGAMLDPAEVVAGLHGPPDRAALSIRIPGASVVVAVAVAAVLLSLAWAWRGWGNAVAGAWGALFACAAAVYVVMPAVVRAARRGATGPAPYEVERGRLERLAVGMERFAEEAPPAFPSAEAALAALHVWDADRVAGTAGRPGAAAEPWPGRAWLVVPGPAPRANDPTGAAPGWAELHRGASARSGPPLVAVELDTALAMRSLPGADSAIWFGPGLDQFAVAHPDTWPAARVAGISLAGWWRRTALAWALQSPELARAETDGLALLWRRDPRKRLERLLPFATFDPPTPVATDGELWWMTYGQVASETFALTRPVAFDGRPVRYLRAGLVGTVHAGTGETRVYLAPGYDSLSAAWSRWFAPLIQPPDSLPPAIRLRLPYPRRAFRAAAEQVVRARPDTAPWTPQPREAFDLVGPRAERWTAQAFEAGNPASVRGLLAATMDRTGPRLVFWAPGEQERLPPPLVGSPRTRPGVLRLWPTTRAVLSLQGLFAEVAPARPTRLLQVYLSWGDRVGEGETAAAALRQLLAAGPPGAPLDTSLAARWSTARRLALQADSALAAGDLERFGRLYDALKRVLGVARPKLAPSPRPE